MLKFKEMAGPLAVLRGSIPEEVEQKLRNPAIRPLLRGIPGAHESAAHMFTTRETVRAAIHLFCGDAGITGEEYRVIDAALEEWPHDPTFANIDKPEALGESNGLDAIISGAGNGEEIDLVVLVEPEGNPYSRRRISAEITWSKWAKEAEAGLAVIRIPASRLVAPLLASLGG